MLCFDVIIFKMIKLFSKYHITCLFLFTNFILHFYPLLPLHSLSLYLLLLHSLSFKIEKTIKITLKFIIFSKYPYDLRKKMSQYSQSLKYFQNYF